MQNKIFHEDFDDLGIRLNYDNWIPDEKDKIRILKEIREQYEANAELCGADSEEAEEMETLYKKVFRLPLKESKEEVQDFFTQAYLAVNGELHKYYSDEELVNLIYLTVL